MRLRLFCEGQLIANVAATVLLECGDLVRIEHPTRTERLEVMGRCVVMTHAMQAKPLRRWSSTWGAFNNRRFDAICNVPHRDSVRATYQMPAGTQRPVPAGE